MKRHVAILAAGAVALASGLLITVNTADDANAAVRSFSTSRSFTTHRTFSNKTLSNKTLSNKTKFTTSKTKFTTSKKFSTSKTKFSNTKFNINKFGNLPKGLTAPKGISLGPNALKGPKGISLGPKAANLAGPKLLPKGQNFTLINKKNFTIFRGPRGIWWNGRLRTLVALGVLGGIYVGGTYFLADGYVPIGYPVCRGLTEEGCSLVWRDVPTEDGDVIAQCVQFCPRAPTAVSTEAPPAVAAPTLADTRTAAAAVPAGAMAKGCDMSIHADPNFGGINSQVTDDQPQLSVSGWNQAISSITVKSGIWDFYADENYGGQMIRLAPGQYPTLAQGWDKTINSLMCAQP